LGFSQFIDPNLLMNKLFQSIYYLHIQPPLFNLFLGIVLKLFPNNYTLAFNLIYLICGLILAISFFSIATRLGMSNKLGAILAVLFIISPSCVLFENLLYYTYPCATLLCLSALFLHKFLDTSKLRYGGIFLILLSIIVLTRSLFHIIWFVLFALMVFYIHT
jgi:4-amino-4-deoxy-L-arabinose transferase-like glycosyltransferase